MDDDFDSNPNFRRLKTPVYFSRLSIQGCSLPPSHPMWLGWPWMIFDKSKGIGDQAVVACATSYEAIRAAARLLE